jgi:hypothetical protein
MPVSIWEGKKAERVASALEMLALNSAGQVSDLTYQGVRNIVRGGLAPKAFDIGMQFAPEHENSMTAGIGASTGITAAAVNEATFLAAEGVIGTGIHVFKFSDGVWHYEGQPVLLATYGITVTGTPASGDVVIITEEYNQIDMDVVSFGDAENANSETVPAMWLESHWALTGIQFDASEAIWACEEVLPAGTYYFKIGNNWGTHCVKDKVYQFTLENDVPVGGQIVIGNGTNFYVWGAPDVAPSNWKVYTFSGPKSVTPINGPVALTDVTEGTPSGTDLGTLSSAAVYATAGGALNNLQRCAYGYNRWSQSAMRQWLNSDKPIGEWWEPQNPFDRPPQQLATVRGFLAGLDADFLAIVQPVKVKTALNTVSDSVAGSPLIGEANIENKGTAQAPVLVETTIDRFFCASLEQEYIAPQLSGAEGSYWPYWKDRLALSSPQAQGSGGTNAKHIRYAVENHTSAQTVRLRSAHRGYAHYVWYVYSSGYAGYYSATSALRPAPACVIC